MTDKNISEDISNAVPKSPMDRLELKVIESSTYLKEKTNRNESDIFNMEKRTNDKFCELTQKLDKLADTLVRQNENMMKAVASFETTVAPFIQQTNTNTENIKQLTEQVRELLSGMSSISQLSMAHEKILQDTPPKITQQKLSVIEKDINGNNGVVERLEKIESFFNGLGWKIALSVTGLVGAEVLIQVISYALTNPK